LGIPTAQILFEDQVLFSQRVSLLNGVKQIRLVVSERVGTGEQRVTKFWDNLVKALTVPLTAAEKESGRYEPAPPPRIIYEGTLIDAQRYFNQSMPIAACKDCPIAKFTDGLPVIVPTESAVKEMLAGTSHSPDELIYAYTMNMTTKQIQKAKTPMQYGFNRLMGTVENVAVNAVMAGCKPEYLPVVLAIANSNLSTGTDPLWSQWEVVSGPFAKEIGMNSMVGMMEPGNIANRPICRSMELMAINLGGAVVGVNRMNSLGHPANGGGTCFAENDEGLPPGWLTMREEEGYKKTDSVVMTFHATPDIIQSTGNGAAGSFYRGFQEGLGPSGKQGSPALRLEVEGKGKFVGVSGPHNFLEITIDTWWLNNWGAQTIVIIPRMAMDLYGAGFKTKSDIYKYIWNKSARTKAQHDLIGFRSTGGYIEEETGLDWRTMPPTTIMHAAGGSDPTQNLVLVGGGTYEEWFRLTMGRGSTYPIDVWK
jgi:hypothetical protein